MITGNIAVDPMRPDQTKAHTKIVQSIDDKNKTFQSSQGVRAKFIIHFTDGYSAEYCPLISQRTASVIEGQPVTFLIRHRKDFGDEIDIPFVPERTPVVPGTAPVPATVPATNGKVFSMQGHPASLALLAAKDIYIAKIKEAQEDTIFEILQDADIIYDWLVQKAT